MTSRAGGIWRSRAQRLGLRLPRSRLHPAVLAWAAGEKGGRPPRGAWAVAFSGGSDSLALLLLLWAHWPEQRGRLWALHFDHRLRGAAARADAAFCRRVSAALGVHFELGVWLNGPRAPSEADARDARMQFFAGVCRRRRIGALWFGHQQDDIAETMLMRLARGSGSGGLAAPRPVARHDGGPLRLRPLLTLRKREIAASLRACLIPWREDATNPGETFFRNRVRQRVIGRWEAAAGRDAVAGAAWARELIQEDDEALEAWTEARKAMTAGGKLRLGQLVGCPRAVWRRALHKWLMVNCKQIGTLSRPGFGILLAAIERGRPFRQSVGPRTFAVVGGGHLRIERARTAKRRVGSGRKSAKVA
jgi:tRNA(Ile)-lysidine synthase